MTKRKQFLIQDIPEGQLLFFKYVFTLDVIYFHHSFKTVVFCHSSEV